MSVYGSFIYCVTVYLTDQGEATKNAESALVTSSLQMPVIQSIGGAVEFS